MCARRWWQVLTVFQHTACSFDSVLDTVLDNSSERPGSGQQRRDDPLPEHQEGMFSGVLAGINYKRNLGDLLIVLFTTVGFDSSHTEHGGVWRLIRKQRPLPPPPTPLLHTRGNELMIRRDHVGKADSAERP